MPLPLPSPPLAVPRPLAVAQCWAYWLLGQLDDTPASLARSAGYYKALQSAGGAASWALSVETSGVLPSTQALINVALALVAFPLALMPVLRELPEALQHGQRGGRARARRRLRSHPPRGRHLGARPRQISSPAAFVWPRRTTTGLTRTTPPTCAAAATASTRSRSSRRRRAATDTARPAARAGATGAAAAAAVAAAAAAAAARAGAAAAAIGRSGAEGGTSRARRSRSSRTSRTTCPPGWSRSGRLDTKGGHLRTSGHCGIPGLRAEA